MEGSFTYLFIPTDESLPVEERSLSFAESSEKLQNEVGCLTTCLAQHFATAAPLSEEVQAGTNEQLEEEARRKGMQLNASQRAELARMSRTQMVEVTVLLPGTKANGWSSVSLYSDDTGVAKGLALNVRATKLCVACGRPMRMMGDVFVARAQDDNHDLYHRQSMTLADFSPSATWVREAALAAAERAAQRAAQPPASTQPTPERLQPYAAELQGWVASKLAEFDGDASVRKAKGKKHGDREGYEAFLQAKVKAKLASGGADTDALLAGK